VHQAVHQCERTRITAWREGFTLVGVVAAAALPAMFDADLARGLERLAWMFLPLLAFASVISLLAGPPASGVRPQHANLREALSRALANRAFTRLLAVFAFNGIASAVPATLVLFFVADVLQLESLNGLFLVLYFVAGLELKHVGNKEQHQRRRHGRSDAVEGENSQQAREGAVCQCPR
jgi:Na+/melibiose symporter-like transporter